MLHEQQQQQSIPEVKLTEAMFFEGEKVSQSIVKYTVHINPVKKPIQRKKPAKAVKESRVQMIINNLPNGVTYIGPEGELTEQHIMAWVKHPKSCKEGKLVEKIIEEEFFKPKRKGGRQDAQGSNEMIDIVNQDTLKIGIFQIDFKVITVKGMILMRNLLPKEEYRLIKNRMCARVSRAKRRNQVDTLEGKLIALKEENSQLKRRLNYLQNKQSSKQTYVNEQSFSSADSFVASDDSDSSDNASNHDMSVTKKTPVNSLNDSIAMDPKKQFKDAKALFSPSDELKIPCTQPKTSTLRNDKHIAANARQSPDTDFSLAMPFANNEETGSLFMTHADSKLPHISTDETYDVKFLSPLETILNEKGLGAQHALYAKQFSAWEETK